MKRTPDARSIVLVLVLVFSAGSRQRLGTVPARRLQTPEVTRSFLPLISQPPPIILIYLASVAHSP